jgi:N-acetylglucosamine-6-phosphate deacetylase
VIGKLLDGRTVRLDFHNGRIAEIAPVQGESDRWILPGLVDIQVNGYAGHDVNAENVTADDIAGLVRAEWAAGITAICPTIITAPEDRIVAALQAIRAARAADPLIAHAIPCVHIEGPHIAAADGPRGAHDARFLRPPDIAEFHRWHKAADGLIGIVTLAPELPGAVEYIREITAAGVIAAIGHTAASTADIAAAADAGARLSTHLGNGAHAVLPRHPNYIWDQLAEDRLNSGIIADGHHLADSVLRVMLRAKGIPRVVLVSDTVALAGMPPGQYVAPVGGQVELTADGRLVLAGSTLLAGATRNLAECVGHLLQLGIPLTDVARMTSTNPARLLGLAERGGVEVGNSADLTLFADGIGVVGTVVAGELVARGE